ncbi:MAG: hypothetical protein CMM93_09315 [Rickettsiales bacterium]|nr:hypothetical protein [Rickettsiales bacterium]
MEAYDATNADRYLLRFGPDEELVEALVGWVAMRGGRATVRGTGAFQSSVVADVDGEERKVSGAEAISISGVVAGGAAQLRVTLLRGMQPIGGTLVSATALGADLEVFVLDPDEEAEVSAPTTAASASPGWGDVAAASAAAAQAKPAATGGAPSWAEVAAASQTAAAQPAPRTKKRRKPKPQEPLFQPDPLPGQKQKDLSYLEEPQPEIGDFVLHKQFGKCKVERIGEDGGLVIKTAGGRRRAIKLTVLEVLPPHEDNQGRMVYPVQPRRR